MIFVSGDARVAAGETIRVVARALRSAPRAFQNGRDACARPAACCGADWRPQAARFVGRSRRLAAAGCRPLLLRSGTGGGACRARRKVYYRSSGVRPSRGAELQKKPSWRRSRPADVARKRARWKAYQDRIDRRRLVFIDETWVKTNMAPLRGWGRAGQRLRAMVPYGHWKTMTFLAPCAMIASTHLGSSTAQSTANCSSSMSGRSLSRHSLPETLSCSIISVPTNRMP